MLVGPLKRGRLDLSGRLRHQHYLMGADKNILFRVSPADHAFLSSLSREWQIPMSRWFDCLLTVLAEDGQTRAVVRERILKEYHAKLAGSSKHTDA